MRTAQQQFPQLPRLPLRRLPRQLPQLRLQLPQAPAGGAGKYRVEAGAAGKVFKVEASVGQAVKKGDAIVIVEAMKMEIPMVAPEDGTVVSIDCHVGDPVEAGTLLATID